MVVSINHGIRQQGIAMSHQLVLIVPDKVYAALAQSATAAGSTPEQIAADWLALMGWHAARDPFERHIGALPSNVPDWADRHDEYIGKAVMDSHDATKSGS